MLLHDKWLKVVEIVFFCTVSRQLLVNLSSTFFTEKWSIMETVKIYPEITTWKKNKSGLCPITIRFDINGCRIGNQPLNFSIDPIHWDRNKRNVKSSHHDHQLYNLTINNQVNKHNRFFLQRVAFGLPINVDLVKKYLKNRFSVECFYEFAEALLENKKLKDGKGYSPESKRSYRDEIKRLMSYKEQVSFRDLTPNFLSAYKLWLQNEYIKKDGNRLDQNSIWKAFKFIRMVYNEAVRVDLIIGDENPFKKFDVGSCVEDPDKIKYLERHELEKIESLLLSPSHSLQELTIRIGWRFLAMCVSGLRISDAMNLDEMFFNDRGDLEFIPHKTRRHGNKAQVPIISDRQRFYLEKSISLPLPKTDHKNFRTTFNIHLKYLGAAAGIKTNLTSHVGRHTMGSFLVDAGVETKAAMAMLGIKREKVIQTYMHLKESKLQQEALKLKNVF